MTDAGPDYTLVQPGDNGLGGGIMQAPEGTPPYVTVYVWVDDLETKLAEIQQLGGKTIVPPTAIGEAASFALFADPEGAMVGLLHPRRPHLISVPDRHECPRQSGNTFAPGPRVRLRLRSLISGVNR